MCSKFYDCWTILGGWREGHWSQHPRHALRQPSWLLLTCQLYHTVGDTELGGSQFSLQVVWKCVLWKFNKFDFAIRLLPKMGICRLVFKANLDWAISATKIEKEATSVKSLRPVLASSKPVSKSGCFWSREVRKRQIEQFLWQRMTNVELRAGRANTLLAKPGGKQPTSPCWRLKMHKYANTNTQAQKEGQL